MTPNAYLAGPDVFHPKAIERGKAMVDALKQSGINGLYPLDNEIKDFKDVSLDIFKANVALIDRSQIVLANIAPFRGSSLDPGTAWEIGYAYAKGIPVVCYGVDGKSLLERARGLGVCPHDGKIDANGDEVEDFGLVDNLMIARCATEIVDFFEDAVEAAVRILQPAEAGSPIIACFRQEEVDASNFDSVIELTRKTPDLICVDEHTEGASFFLITTGDHYTQEQFRKAAGLSE